MKLGQGYIFRSMCQEFCPQGGMYDRGMCVAGGVHGMGHAWQEGVHGGRHAWWGHV